jgi:hypothetical protein
VAAGIRDVRTGRTTGYGQTLGAQDANVRRIRADGHTPVVKLIRPGEQQLVVESPRAPGLEVLGPPGKKLKWLSQLAPPCLDMRMTAIFATVALTVNAYAQQAERPFEREFETAMRVLNDAARRGLKTAATAV